MSDELFDTDIPWALAPVPARPRVDLEPSTADELGWVYADLVASEVHFASVDADLEMYRDLLHQALAQVATLTALVQKQTVKLQDQARQLREFYEVR